MRWTSGLLVFLLLLAAGAVAVGVISRLPQKEIVLPAPPPPAAVPLPPPTIGSEWRYTEPRAPYASDVGVEACTRSQADVQIGGGAKSSARFCLRAGGGYPYAGSIVLGDTSGQFVCTDCEVKVTFDQRQPQTLDATAASADGTAYALFCRDGPRLAAELKRASTATFTVTLRGGGVQQVTFNVGGLRWDR